MVAEYLFTWLAGMCVCFYCVSQILNTPDQFLIICSIVVIENHFSGNLVNPDILFSLFLQVAGYGQGAVGTGHAINLPICLFHAAKLLINPLSRS